MRLGVTGTRKVSPDDVLHVARFIVAIARKYEIDEVTTGGCYGVDEIAGMVMKDAFPDIRHRVCVSADERTKLLRSDWYTVHGDVIVDRCPEGTDNRYRNARILENSDVVAAIPPGLSSSYPYSGTWMTVRMAKERHLPVELCLVDDLGEFEALGINGGESDGAANG